jgi:hypothetical protein
MHEAWKKQAGITVGLDEAAALGATLVGWTA